MDKNIIEDMADEGMRLTERDNRLKHHGRLAKKALIKVYNPYRRKKPFHEAETPPHPGRKTQDSVR